MAAEFQFVLETWEKLKKGKSSVMDTWLLFSSPLPIVSILITYAAFVLYLGPKFMLNRKPYNLKSVIILYNAVQVCYNSFNLIHSIFEPLFWKYFLSFGCVQVTPQEELYYNMLMYRTFWYMTVNKIMDLLDTVFFILNKKQNHITFLHVQHHILSAGLLWTCGKYFTGQETTVAYFCNTIVHTIMYSYYFLAALGPSYKKYIWWKKHLTLIQIVQFIIIISYSTMSFWFSCGYDTRILWLVVANGNLNLILFLNFYFNAYNSKKLMIEKRDVCGSLQFGLNSTTENQGGSFYKADSYKKEF